MPETVVAITTTAAALALITAPAPYPTRSALRPEPVRVSIRLLGAGSIELLTVAFSLVLVEGGVKVGSLWCGGTRLLCGGTGPEGSWCTGPIGVTGPSMWFGCGMLCDPPPGICGACGVVNENRLAPMS